ncbi:MAG: glycoside hydrolase family 31 protein [Bacteroidales bacterium]|nr:glycoside hydrolase family 31 protein [Bacteroidales bacterium]
MRFFRQLILSCALLLGFLMNSSAQQMNVSNPIVFGNNRLTLITPTLFRLEYAHEGKFIDEPTLFAYDRTSLLKEGEFAVKKIGDNKYEITTDKLRMVYENDGYPFGLHNFKAYFTLDGKEKEFTNRSIKKNNLGGPVETLDRVTEEIPMNDGLLSTDGWYLIDDERADLLSNGWLKARDTKNHVQDQYCFVYGNDYKAALADLGAISGKIPMTRKYIHGVWYCRYWDYTAEEFLDIIKGYEENDFPIDNLVMDMGWHTDKQATMGTGHASNRGWTGYTWEKNRIPDPKALIDAVHSKNITVSLNDHPHDGLRPHEEHYLDFMKEMGADSSKPILFDLGDRKYMETFFKWAHKPSEDIGVDFWWLDWQQNYLYPNVRGYNTTSLMWLNELYYNRSQERGQRGISYSRWAGWGDHRHPIQFSGDAQSNWELLAFEVKLSAASGNAGCTYWAHDLGGFRGTPNEELTARWTQFGALSAALRVHCTKDAKLDRRPWLGQDIFTDALRKSYHMRSEIMPYVYTSVWQTSSTMIPLNRPMYIEYPMTKEAFENEQEYLFGDLILAAPIASAGKGEKYEASQKVWFPEGDIWYDYFTGESFKGGQTATITKPIDEFPMYIKGGWVMPMQPYTDRPATAALTNLVMRVYPSEGDVEANTYTLYEDDGISNDYKEGKFATTALTYSRKGNVTTIAVSPAVGTYKDQPQTRQYTLVLPVHNGKAIVKVNGKKAQLVKGDTGYQVSVKATDIHKSVTIVITD